MSVRDACEDTLSARVKSAFSLMADLCFAQERAIMPHKKSIHRRGHNPNSRTASPMKKGKPWIGRASHDAKIAGTKGGKVSGRSTVGLKNRCKKEMRKKGSACVVKYLEAQGFHVKSGTVQEVLMFRLFESAIYGGDPLSMAQIFTICMTGKTIGGFTKTPNTQADRDGLNKDMIREVVLETVRIWQNNHRKAERVKTVKPPRVKPPSL